MLHFLKEEFPNKAIDLTESLELLKESISETLAAINKRINTLFSQRNFDDIGKYNELAKEAHRFECQVEELINILDVRESSTVNDHERREIPNYDEYLVDTNVEHTLYENFTHIRPYAFSLTGYSLIEVKTWLEMLVETSEILFNIDPEKFMSFKDNRKMNGKKVKYFSDNPDDVRKPAIIEDKIYIETNLSANSIRNLILKMLKEYGFRVNDYKVYFKADYSSTK